MKIRIIAVGKIKERFTQEWIDEFLKRMDKYINLELIEQKEQDNVEREAENILKILKPDDFIVSLDVNGKIISSEELSKLIKDKIIEKNITFIIGSDKGLSEKILKIANYRLSFSRMTFTHQIARLLLVEQIYRAFTIIKGEKYHK